jgi:hypothetical protein
MKTKTVIIKGREFKLLRYKGEWVFPYISTYECGLGSPIAFLLLYLEGDSLELYTDVTVNIPECTRSAGCQFIDTNNNDSGILDWLEENNFGKRTGNTGTSGFCTYPEFNFYAGERFREHK